MSLLSRTRPQFRYKGDPQEVKIMLSREEAYEYADGLIKAGAENGPILKAFLEDTENSDAKVVKARNA